MFVVVGFSSEENRDSEPINDQEKIGFSPKFSVLLISVIGVPKHILSAAEIKKSTLRRTPIDIVKTNDEKKQKLKNIVR